MKHVVIGVLMSAVAMLGCGGDDPPTADSTIEPTPTNTVTGTASFTSSEGHVSVTITVASAPPGVHGMHIHQEPACGNGGMDAGGHWDGTAAAGDATTHGLPDGTTHHVGDLGNITVAADGTGTLTASNHAWKIGDGSMTDVVGHSIIFHANMDDGTMASAGGRIGCGIIAAN